MSGNFIQKCVLRNEWATGMFFDNDSSVGTKKKNVFYIPIKIKSVA